MPQWWETYGQRPCFLPSGQKLPEVREKKGNRKNQKDKDRCAVLWRFLLFGGILGDVCQGLIVIKCSFPTYIKLPNCKFLPYNTPGIQPASWPHCQYKHLCSYLFDLLFLEFSWPGGGVQVRDRSGHLFFGSKSMLLLPWMIWRHWPAFPFLVGVLKRRQHQCFLFPVPTLSPFHSFS